MPFDEKPKLTPEETSKHQETPPPADPTIRLRVVPRESTAPAAEPTRLLPTANRPTPAPHPMPEETEPTRYIPLPAQPPQRVSTAADETQRITPVPHPTPPRPTAEAEPTRLIPPQSQPTQRVSTANAETQRVAPAPRPTPPQWGGPPTPPLPPAPPKKRRTPWTSILLWVTVAAVGAFLLALVGVTIGYVALASQLPPVEELRQRQPDFASSRIYDQDGNLLYELADPTTGLRTYVTINQISRDLQLATVATEDRNFYVHTGFDPIAIVRAVYYAFLEQEIVSGASTITQQVARNILLDAEERTQQTASRKIKEIVLAQELTRQYTKNEVLEIYLNNNNYGNRAYGVDAAARTYFGTSAGSLTLAQAAFLAGLPQAPATYDPYHGGLDAALKRQKVVLGLMVEDGYITEEQAAAAAAEMEAYEFKQLVTERIPAPHFVFYVRQWVEEQLGADALYHGSGLRIYTTLNTDYQRIAEEEVKAGIEALAGQNATNGAIVAIEPATGHILAMVGSVDFYDDVIGGQVNVTTRCRQPGSAIKPLTYLAAFEKGWTPATIAWDIPTTYTDTAGNTYTPVNYDGQFRGPTSVRTALANSLNIPAVKALEYVTVDGLLSMADRLGATSLVSPQLECPDYPYETRPYYGLALTLGGGEMKLIDLTAAYATFANGGLSLSPTPVLWIEDNQGTLLLDNRQRQGKQVVSPQLAYLLTHILSDTQARCLVFQCPSRLELAGRPVAAKTGTTNDYRDAWTLGYTPDLAAGVWVGNNDNTEMLSIAGSSGAAPIWNAFMTRATEGTPVHEFPRPQGVVEREICTLSGAEPSAYCQERTKEIFALDTPPPAASHDWLQKVEIDGVSGKRANQFCRTAVTEKVMVVLDEVQDSGGREWLRQWAASHGYETAPQEYCTASASSDQVRLLRPQNGDEVYGEVEIIGTVALENLERYELQYGYSSSPEAWGALSGPHTTPVSEGVLATWDTEDLEHHEYTIRLVAYTQQGEIFEDRVVVKVKGPTPTPTPEATPTHTAAPTDTPTPTPEPTLTPTETPISTDTPTPTATAAPETPTFTPEPVEPTATWTPEALTPTATLTETVPTP